MSKQKAPEASDSHEGHKLRSVLALHGQRASDLARAMGVSPQSLSRQMKRERINPNAWEGIAGGLTRLGIPPTAVRPASYIIASPPMTDAEKARFKERMLLPSVPDGTSPPKRPNFSVLLDRFQPEQLEVLAQCVGFDEGDRVILLAIIEDRLNRRPPSA